MELTIKCPNITQYSFQFEPSDAIYINCNWAIINLDHDAYTMTATTDCGNYSYSWHVTPSESFVHLMARLNQGYLLDKISSASVFDFDASKRRAVEIAIRCIIPVAIVHALEEMDECDYGTEESFFRRAQEITGWEYEAIPIQKRYPVGAVAFARLFCEYLQPELRKSLAVQKGV